MDATKSLVKDAVETLFDVDVLRVNIVVMPAKRTRRAQEPAAAHSPQRL